MSTKLFLSLVLSLGLSACLTDVELDEPVRSPDDQEVATDPGADLQSDLSGDPEDHEAVAGAGSNTCGGNPRRKADGPCVPN